MSDSRVLLNKITALRQHLEQAQGLSSAVKLPSSATPAEPTTRLRSLERKVATGSQHNALLDGSLRHLEIAREDLLLPRQLTARARRLVERGRELILRLQNLGNDALLQRDETDPVTDWYRVTAAMTDTAVRMVPAFPDAPGLQLRLCDGLESILKSIADRLLTLEAVLLRRRQEERGVEQLTELLSRLSIGEGVEVQAFLNLAAMLWSEAQQLAPLRFLYQRPEQPARYVACHSWNVARVMARLVQQDPEWRTRWQKALLLALVHDVGMAAVPVDVLAYPGRLNDGQKRIIEGHAVAGAEMVASLVPGGNWLVEAVAGHHERVDGTGYPEGKTRGKIDALTRLLAVCDTYAALVAPRPYRPANDTRAALTETLQQAERGALDRHQAECLLQLSFYPVGTVVELADGAVGVVVATHVGRRDPSAPARPILALLTDSQGRLLPGRCHVDLAQGEGHSIVRSLSEDERRKLLGKRYLELV